MKLLIFNDIDSIDDDFVHRCERFLPLWRKEQMLKYRFLKGKIQNGLAYVMLVMLLISECGEREVLNNLPEFSYNEHEKPFLQNYPDLFFSISHCKTAVAVGLSRLPLGIDIEDIARYKDNIVSHVSDESEVGLIQESEHPEMAFIKIWTQKEAVFKYRGTGITDDIKNILNNIDCQLYTKLIGDKFVSVATQETCANDIFDNIFIKLSDLYFI